MSPYISTHENFNFMPIEHYAMNHDVPTPIYMTVQNFSQWIDDFFFLYSESRNLTRQWFAYLDRTDNYTFTFEAGYDDSSVFPGVLMLHLVAPCIVYVTTRFRYMWWHTHAVYNIFAADGVPLDGTPEIVFHTFEIGLVIVFYVLAAVGIVFSIGCLLFNLIFRERK